MHEQLPVSFPAISTLPPLYSLLSYPTCVKRSPGLKIADEAVSDESATMCALIPPATAPHSTIYRRGIPTCMHPDSSQGYHRSLTIQHLGSWGSNTKGVTQVPVINGGVRLVKYC